MHRIFLACLAIVLSAPLLAQNPRTPGLVGNAASWAHGPAVAADGDLSAIVYRDDFDESIRIIFSDGRGINWSPPARVDSGSPTPKILFRDSVAIVQNATGYNVYVYWEDAVGVIWLNVSTNGGATWTPDLFISNGVPGGFVWDARMEVDPLSGPNPNDDIVAILMEVTLAPFMQQLHLNYSINSGATFLPAGVPFSGHPAIIPTVDVDFMDLDVENSMIVGVWHDDFVGGGFEEVYVSIYDALLGFFPFQDVQISNPLAPSWANDQVAIDARGTTIAALWMDLLPTGVHELHASVSPNWGVTWTPDTRVGNYTAGIDVDHPDVAIAQTGNIVAAWEDNRLGGTTYNVCSAVSLNVGVTWLNDVVASQSSAGYPLTLLSPEDQPVILFRAPNPVGNPDWAIAILSDDAGLTWNPEVVVSNNTGQLAGPAMAFDPVYTNFIMAWRADDLGANDIYAGGFRPQTLIPVGNFTVPGSQVWFDAMHWPHKDRGQKFAVVASYSLGSYTLADGRDLGIVKDALFDKCLTLIPGTLTGTIDAFGNGSTSTFNVPALTGTVYPLAAAYVTLTQVRAVTDYGSIP